MILVINNLCSQLNLTFRVETNGQFEYFDLFYHDFSVFIFPWIKACKSMKESKASEIGLGQPILIKRSGIDINRVV